ncbi:microtubule-associated protein Jupiter isoform X2 [Orussus abietinus]|uniref:microtubule-associated protein Jupiter isoform X2 n=1 Tax=Orussus abietinus TaxID=222816 RepID=UPI000625196F|nr:microtubule-associated protein Jupiter isoform X2 [Orussus abietinus]
MTSTGTFQGLLHSSRKSSKVLKPPGGGSSDIFGAGPEDANPRRVKNHNQSQLGSAIFGDSNGPSAGNGQDTPRASKPGNDSYSRLFGPPDAPPTPNSKNHMRSHISLSGESPGASSPAKSTNSSTGNLNGLTNGNGANNNDISGGSSCMPRNPVTGDGVYVTPVRRSTRKSRDGNPVTGTGYGADQQNTIGTLVQNGNGNATTNGTEKSNESSPGSGPRTQGRTRVPPGGFSSGLW